MSEALRLLRGLIRKTPVSKPDSSPARVEAECFQPKKWTYEELLAELPPEEGLLLQLYHYLATEEERVAKENDGTTLDASWSGGLSSQQKLASALKYGFVASLGRDYIPFSWLYSYSDGHSVGSQDLRLHLKEEDGLKSVFLLSNIGPLVGMDEYFTQAFGNNNFPVSVKDRHGYFWENQAYVTLRENKETKPGAYV